MAVATEAAPSASFQGREILKSIAIQGFGAELTGNCSISKIYA